MTAIYAHAPRAQVSPAYYQALVDFLHQKTGDSALLESNLDTVAPLQGPVIIADYLSLVKRANSLLSADWGIELGLQFRPATYGILGLLPLHCDNLLEALNMVLRFEGLVHELGISTVTAQQDKLVFSWQANFFDEDCLKPVAESVIAGMQQFSSWLSGRVIPVSCLVLPAPCHHPWLKTLGIQPSIQAGKLEMHLNIQDLLVPIPQADEQIKQALLTSAELMLQKKQPKWIKKLLNWFDLYLPNIDCTLEQAADLLKISPRSLQRRLQKQGLTYQQLLSGFRQDKAVRLLKESSMSILEIASTLGFQEQSSFSNAFKGWLGCSPMEFTKTHKA